ncbi:TonB family protein [Providencia burhodogranariea]|uniref:Energy transducer TonB n=1 Tax=Providencia burhodogranariea DSM 19968 TaxID=1141662 RepID=K8WNK1_9GAMM|nr:energy transducer TonB [Providencia burhodogranariea]EKT62144.1 energy transducer TonB [Providencia burhodogranariea DSM 19968]
MMKNTKFLTFIISILLHIVIIVGFVHIQQQHPNKQHQAIINAPVISIALTQAVKEIKSVETETLPFINNDPLIESLAIVENAQIIVPFKDKKIEQQKTVVKKEKAKPVTVKKDRDPQKEPVKKTDKSSTKPQKSMEGETAFSQSMGTQGKLTQLASNVVDNSELNIYREKLRQEVERNKQYPRRAKKMKNRGATQIQFYLTATGDITSANIVSSSGNELLDKAALSAVEKSSSVGIPPVDFLRSVTFKIEFK